MNRASRRCRPRVEVCEVRALTALIFVLNGNAFSAAGPNTLTEDAARLLSASGNRVIQLSYPTIGTLRAFHRLADQIARLSDGRPIGLVGFSAGGTLAARLSGLSELNVKAVLDDYGPPDLRAWAQSHGRDRFAQYVFSHVRFSPGFLDAMSGPSPSTAYIAAAFGQQDDNVTAPVSAASFARDFAVGHVYTYRGGHGAAIGASRPALEDFLAHLG